jgi:hypothetical protein
VAGNNKSAFSTLFRDDAASGSNNANNPAFSAGRGDAVALLYE